MFFFAFFFILFLNRERETRNLEYKTMHAFTHAHVEYLRKCNALDKLINIHRLMSFLHVCQACIVNKYHTIISYYNLQHFPI